MKKIIQYFAGKPLFTNFLMIAVFTGAVIFWNQTGKEEMPNITFDFVLISASYTGASSEETEYFVTREIENAITGINGIYSMRSTTGAGSCRVFIELEPDNPDRDDVIQEIKDAVDRLSLPEDVEDTLHVREFKSSNRSIVDLMLYYEDTDILTEKQRRELQATADILEEYLSGLLTVSEITKSYDLEDRIEIYVLPEKLKEYEISLSEIANEIKKNNIRQPLGTLNDIEETKITFTAELKSLDDIRNVIIRSGFEGYILYLKDVAEVTRIFNDQSSIFKVNGSEAIRLNVVKTSSAGIIEAMDEVKEVVKDFSETVLKDSQIKLVLSDDESMSVRNRLSLIFMNGLFGFLLLIFLLFFFLNFRSGFWVAMGIPFAFGFTMVFASLLGYNINNMTLAAVIIVMGMVVDDAIVVAENITRLKSQGVPAGEAVVKGTALVFVPILASITTTCVAFVPLFFFGGFFGMMTKYIPPIIFLMLGGSLFEAIIILPSHLKHDLPRWLRIIFSLGTLPLIERYYAKKKAKKNKKNNVEVQKTAKRAHWFYYIEDIYGKFLKLFLPVKWIFFLFIIGLFIYSFNLFSEMKFVLFPHEETTEVVLSGKTEEGMLKYDTEKQVREIEDILLTYLNQEVVGIQTRVSVGRRGSVANENSFSIYIELLPKEQREKSANELIAEWEDQLSTLNGFNELRFSKSRFGQSSGSPIDIVVRHSDDAIRGEIAAEILSEMEKIPALINSEIEKARYDSEIKININRSLMGKLAISPESVNTTLKTILGGQKLFEITEEDKDIDVILTIHPRSKMNIESVLQIPVQNSMGYLVPIKSIATIERLKSPNSIERLEKKRILHIYADLREENDSENETVTEEKNPGSEEKILKQEESEKLDLPEIMTPLEIAEYLEINVFPEILQKYPGSRISFEGEIKETRESGSEFIIAIISVVIMIYIILALSLNSLFKPFIIMLSIPFGFIGIVFAFQAHGMIVYGFFSVVGAIGLAGIVVNDSIVMLDKLEREYDRDKSLLKPSHKVANIAKTRLRAVFLTTATTVAGLMPTAYGIFGYDSMLAEMMLTLSWGLIFGTLITLLLVPSLFCLMKEIELFFKKGKIKDKERIQS